MFGNVQQNFAESGTDLFAAAEKWWRMKRPDGWSEKHHLKNPTVNCVGNEARALALEIAKIIVAEQSK
jgi:hypothetical protein